MATAKTLHESIVHDSNLDREELIERARDSTAQVARLQRQRDEWTESEVVVVGSRYHLVLICFGISLLFFQT